MTSEIFQTMPKTESDHWEHIQHNAVKMVVVLWNVSANMEIMTPADSAATTRSIARMAISSMTT